MKIEIKANIGDEIFFMHENKVTSSTVIDISINIIGQKNLYNYISDFENKRILQSSQSINFYTK